MGQDATLVLDELGLANQRTVRAFLSLANAGDTLTAALDESSEAWRENTALTDEAEQFYDTTASQLAILKNNLVAA